MYTVHIYIYSIGPTKFMVRRLVPSGKHTKNYGKIHHFSW